MSVTKGDHLGTQTLRVLAVLDLLTRRNHYPPTMREIGEYMDLAYGSVDRHLRNLEERGLITTRFRQPRSAVITAEGRKHLS